MQNELRRQMKRERQRENSDSTYTDMSTEAKWMIGVTPMATAQPSSHFLRR